MSQNLSYDSISKVLYVGQFQEGSTSKMRGTIIRDLVAASTFKVINTNAPFVSTHRIIKSIGFRFKAGPLIHKINRFVLLELDNMDTLKFDLIWVDKGIFLYPSTVDKLKNISMKIVHYTPDMAFYENRSRNFEKAINVYDYLITTKTRESSKYLDKINRNKLLFTTQGYSKYLHYPRHHFEHKDGTVAFIGLAEKSRFLLIDKLINNGVRVKLAGYGWKNFVDKHKNNLNLEYHGEGLFGENYVKFISSASFALGLLSKNFPELHTTRTFEIPACGTALLTEENEETSKYFDENNAIFFSNTLELIEKIKHFSKEKEKLKTISKNGLKNVRDKGFDYHSIINSLLTKILR